jgi:hypothetical protein
MQYPSDMRRSSPSSIPADLRFRLEAARLDLLALFRALDEMDLTPPEIPQSLIHQLFELDADCAEALWALDQPPGQIDNKLMVRDTLATLEQLPSAVQRFKRNLAGRASKDVELLQARIRQKLDPQEAYSQIPGRDPQNR